MRFLSIYKCAEKDVPPSPEEMAKMGKLIEDGMKAGFLLAVEGCLPSATGARVRLSRGAVSVTGWAVHRVQGGGRRLRYPTGQLEE
jgi:hypothetical protein